MRQLIKHKLFISIFALALSSIGMAFSVPAAYAAGTDCGGVCQVKCQNGKTITFDVQRSLTDLAHSCDGFGGNPTVVSSAASAGSGAPARNDADPALAKSSSQGANDIINKYINPLILLLSICFGIFVVIGLIIGGIQYSSSAGDPQKVANAKGRIMKVIVALIAYIFLYAFLRFILPTGSGV